MDRTPGYFDPLEAFPLEGCPVCRLGLAAVHRYIETINYESVGDPNIRERLRVSLGFCNIHAYQWLEQAHLLGTANIYIDVLTQILAELRALAFQRQTFLEGVAALLGGPPAQDWESDVLAPRGQCPICRVFGEAEEMLLRTMLAVLPQPAFQGAYLGSSGLCLPHLRQALGQTADEEIYSLLRNEAITHEEHLLTQLREIIRRHDYRYIGEPAGAERGAAVRTINHVVGAPGIPCEAKSQ